SILPNSASADTGSVSQASRPSTRLYDVTTNTKVQDILVQDRAILCLHTNISQKSSIITATDAKGTIIWRYSLPYGVYLGLGISHYAVLVHALYYKPSGSAIPIRDCIVALDPASETLNLIGSLNSSTGRRLSFAGDSSFVRLESGSVELWTVDNSLVRLAG